MTEITQEAIPAFVPAQVLEFIYTNHRGETSKRRVIPDRIWFGSNQWHTKEQWHIRALDVDRGVVRDFAVDDMRHREDDKIINNLKTTLTTFASGSEQLTQMVMASNPPTDHPLHAAADNMNRMRLLALSIVKESERNHHK